MTGMWEENDLAEYRDKYTVAYTGRGIYANANTLHILSTKEWEPVAFVICMH